MEDTLKAAQQAAEEAQAALHSGIKAVTGGVREAAALGQTQYDALSKSADDILGVGKAHLDSALGEYAVYEDQFFAALKDGVAWGAANPYVAYPAAGFSALVVFPPTRRLLYRMTLGRFQTPDSVVSSNKARLEGLKAKTEEFAKEAQKLQERMLLAEEELNRGYSKLKSTREELQRLASVVCKSEKLASNALKELRGVPNKTPDVLPLRGDAANYLSSLRSQHKQITRNVLRIANKDI